MNTQISCATDDELLKLVENPSYTPYYKELIASEIHRRGLKSAKPQEHLIIYRCGWCGWPCHKNGSCIEIDNDEANNYLKAHKASEVVLVNGACCPNGDEC